MIFLTTPILTKKKINRNKKKINRNKKKINRNKKKSIMMKWEWKISYLKEVQE
jgi:hypothetical protein